MKLTILGSGGFRRTPRPGCHCPVCTEMRETGTQRLGPSLFLHDANMLFDAPEEIAAELESAGIGRIDHLLFTHWHPDHTLGARILEVMNTDWSEDMMWRMAAKHLTQVHMPGPVFDETMSRFGAFFEFWERIGIARVNRMEGPLEAGGVKVEPIVLKSRHLTTTHSTVYVISSGSKKVMYAPCDITPFPRDERFKGCDVMIMQAGWSGDDMALRARNGPHYEISLDEILVVVREYSPVMLVITHIGDEYGLTESELRALEKEHSSVNMRFAHDGMVLDI